MKKRGLHSVFLLFIAFVFNSHGQTPFSAAADSLIMKGMDLTIGTEFDSARAVYQQIIDLYPHHPAGYFYQAANLQSQMMDIENPVYEEAFYDWLHQAERAGQDLLSQGDRNPWTFFYMGSVYSYKGLFQVKNGAVVPGFKSARKGLGLLEKAVKIDSTLFDACLGLGSYKYYAGKYYKYLRWLPWISDERKEGLVLLDKAIQGSTFSYWVAVNTYAWIQYDRKQYEDALHYFDMGLQTYPGSRFFSWGYALCLLRLNRFEEAAACYQSLLEHGLNQKWNNGYNEIEARSKLAEACYGMKQYQAALTQCRAVNQRTLSKDVRSRLSEQFDSAKHIEKECKKQLAKKSS